MGLELAGRARLSPTGAPAQEGDAKILLETDELILRGGVRGRVPLTTLRDVRVRAGVVTVEHAGGTLRLTLGDAAKKFAEKLTAPPKSRLEKMRIASGGEVVLVGVTDATFAAEVKAAGAKVMARAKSSGAQLIVLGVHAPKDLARIATMAKALTPAGALWVIHPKGTAGVKDTDIFGAAKRAGLVYTKVARFSDTHTAEKLVIPKAAR